MEREVRLRDYQPKGIYSNIYDCLGHDNSHLKPDTNNMKTHLELSYHGDPCNKHKFRLLGPKLFYNSNTQLSKDGSIEVIYKTNRFGENPCSNCVLVDANIDDMASSDNASKQSKGGANELYYCRGHPIDATAKRVVKQTTKSIQQSQQSYKSSSK